MAEKNPYFGLMLMYGLGLLVNLGAGVFTLLNESYYFFFFNALAVIICGLRLRDLLRQQKQS